MKPNLPLEVSDLAGRKAGFFERLPKRTVRVKDIKTGLTILNLYTSRKLSFHEATTRLRHLGIRFVGPRFEPGLITIGGADDKSINKSADAAAA
jgi:hypothetical protein